MKSVTPVMVLVRHPAQLTSHCDGLPAFDAGERHLGAGMECEPHVQPRFRVHIHASACNGRTSGASFLTGQIKDL